MRYPVSEEKCSKCPACSLVDRGISCEPLPEDQQYYQCLADSESECSQDMKAIEYLDKLGESSETICVVK